MIEDTRETIEKGYQKSQGQIEFEEKLESRRKCYQETGNLGKESQSKNSTANVGNPLPVIDLFLNPKRAVEKEELLKRAKKTDAGSGNNKVKYY